MEIYKTNGTCSTQITFEVNDNKLTFCQFANGCSGNLNGLAALALGQDIDKLIDSLRGISCRGSTSCPDQLAKALMQYKNKQSGTAR